MTTAPIGLLASICDMSSLAEIAAFRQGRPLGGKVSHPLDVVGNGFIDLGIFRIDPIVRVAPVIFRRDFSLAYKVTIPGRPSCIHLTNLRHFQGYFGAKE
jgi:hypothetical protein